MPQLFKLHAGLGGNQVDLSGRAIILFLDGLARAASPFKSGAIYDFFRLRQRTHPNDIVEQGHSRHGLKPRRRTYHGIATRRFC
jgi:hypothetical protein